MVVGGDVAVIGAYYDDDHGYFNNTNQSVPVNPAVGAFPAPHPLQPFYFEPATRSDTGKMTTRMARPSMTWMPNDTVEVFTSFEYGESKGDGASWTNVTAQRAGVQSDYETTADEIGYTDMVWNQAVVEVNVGEVGDGTLTNILGWRRVNADSATDIDGQFLPIFAAAGFTTQHQLSNEIRWSGSFTDNWESTIGLYYFDQDITYREGRYIWNPAIGNFQRALGGDMDGKNFGAFWNNDLHISDNLTVSAGLRYTDEKKSVNIISGVGGGCADVVTFNCPFDFLQGNYVGPANLVDATGEVATPVLAPGELDIVGHAAHHGLPWSFVAPLDHALGLSINGKKGPGIGFPMLLLLIYCAVHH